MSLREELHHRIDEATEEQLLEFQRAIGGTQLPQPAATPEERVAAFRRLALPGLPVLSEEALSREYIYRDEL
jgi:hypothetical protein